MQLAVLKHIHKEGIQIYFSLVDDFATEQDKDNIVSRMIEIYGIDFQPYGEDIRECEILNLELRDISSIPTIDIG